MRQIPLTRGLVALVDDEDYERVVAAGKWYALLNGRTVYAAHNARAGDGRGITERLHTFLTGFPLTDHINRDGLDNRRANLRPATKAQNAANQKVRSDNTSGFKGASWDKARRSWKAYIHEAGRRVVLGRHPTAEEAAKAYDERAREIYGEFAALNFPRPGERSAR